MMRLLATALLLLAGCWPEVRSAANDEGVRGAYAVASAARVVGAPFDPGQRWTLMIMMDRRLWEDGVPRR